MTSSNIILFFLVIPLSRNFFEGAGEGKRQNGSFVLFGHFFHGRKLLGVFKNPCQKKTESKYSICACINTHTENFGRLEDHKWTTS